MPGIGFGGTFSVGTTVVATGIGRIGSTASVTNPVKQTIRHGALATALSTGAATWTTCSRHANTCEQESYPLAGNSQVHLIAWASGSGSSAGLNQRMNINPKIKALQGSNVEFTFSNNAWWESTAKFSDVILPAATIGEVDDITTWLNYIVYEHTLQAPVGEAMSDYAIYTGIAQKLSLDQQAHYWKDRRPVAPVNISGKFGANDLRPVPRSGILRIPHRPDSSGQFNMG